MIPQIWDKKIVAEICLSDTDVADQVLPLPLYLDLAWNHYIGLYYDEIVAFFSSYVLYPWNKDQFYLKLEGQNIQMNGTQIVGHLVTVHNQGLKSPIKFTCHFRNPSPIPSIQIKKYFKYTLKASTAIRNAKLGSSLMTLHMSIDNVEKMYQSFLNSDLKQYLGSNDFQNSGQLGYEFLISKTQRIPVRMIGQQFTIERSVDKETSLGKLLVYVFEQAEVQRQNSMKKIQLSQQKVKNPPLQKSNEEIAVEQVINTPNGAEQQTDPKQNQSKNQKNLRYNYIFKNYNFYMHGIKLTRGQYPLSFFQRFCHPDGFLYIFFKEKN